MERTSFSGQRKLHRVLQTDGRDQPRRRGGVDLGDDVPIVVEEDEEPKGTEDIDPASEVSRPEPRDLCKRRDSNNSARHATRRSDWPAACFLRACLLQDIPEHHCGQ